MLCEKDHDCCLRQIYARLARPLLGLAPSPLPVSVPLAGQSQPPPPPPPPPQAPKQRASVLRLLDVSALNADRETLLDVACLHRSLKCVRFLLQTNADLRRLQWKSLRSHAFLQAASLADQLARRTASSSASGPGTSSGAMSPSQAASLNLNAGTGAGAGADESLAVAYADARRVLLSMPFVETFHPFLWRPVDYTAGPTLSLDRLSTLGLSSASREDLARIASKQAVHRSQALIYSLVNGIRTLHIHINYLEFVNYCTRCIAGIHSILLNYTNTVHYSTRTLRELGFINYCQ